MRHTVQTERNIEQRSISTVYPILCITGSSLWRSFVRIGSENKAAENPTSSEKLIRIALRLPPWASVLGKFNELKIGTVFEYHIYELFKFSLAQIRNGFQNLTIGIQQRHTRNVSFNVWNFSEKNDMLDQRAIILMNALRKWGVLPSDKMICEMDDKQFEKWYHKTSDLYIFENGELTKLIYK